MASKGREVANIVSSKTGIAVTISGDPVILGVGNTEHLRLTGDGKIGIRTDNPVDNLQIGGADNAVGQTPKALSIRHGTVPAYLSASFDGASYITNLSSNIYDNSDQSQSWSSFSSSAFAAAAIQLTCDSNDSNINFYTATTDNTNPSHRMRINHDGKIGFGTDLTGSSGIPYTFVHPTDGSAGAASILQVATHSNSDLYLSLGAKENVAGSGGDGSSYIRAGSGASLNNILIVETAVAGTETEQMRIDGTTSGITSVFIGDYTSSLAASGFISKQHGDPWGMTICASRSSTAPRSLAFNSHQTQEVARFTDDTSPYLRLSSNCSGIQFNGEVSADDTLDYYEEGTWTPDIEFGNANVGLTYLSRAGAYTRIGNIVWCRFVMSLTNRGSSTGSMHISGLPFAVKDSLGGTQLDGEGMITYRDGNPAVSGLLRLFPNDGESNADLYILYEDGTDSDTGDHTYFSNTSSIRGYVWYYV
jgi:hypothetical protein